MKKLLLGATFMAACVVANAQAQKVHSDDLPVARPSTKVVAVVADKAPAEASPVLTTAAAQKPVSKEVSKPAPKTKAAAVVTAPVEAKAAVVPATTSAPAPKKVEPVVD